MDRESFRLRAAPSMICRQSGIKKVNVHNCSYKQACWNAHLHSECECRAFECTDVRHSKRTISLIESSVDLGSD